MPVSVLYANGQHLRANGRFRVVHPRIDLRSWLHLRLRQSIHHVPLLRSLL